MGDVVDYDGRSLVDERGRALRRHVEVIDETPEQERERVRLDEGDIAVARIERAGGFRGGKVFICMRVAEEDLCALCRVRLAAALCDWPEGGTTCDLSMCRNCATSIAREVDLCPVHREAFERIGGMPR